MVVLHHSVYLRWKQRNTTLHGENTNHTKRNLLQRIRGLYALQQDLSPQDHQPFNVPLQDWSQKTEHDMSKWLNLHSEHIKLCLSQTKQRAKNSLQDLRQWMIPPSKRTTPTPAPNNTHTSTPKKQQTLINLFRRHDKSDNQSQPTTSSNKPPKPPNAPTSEQTTNSTTKTRPSPPATPVSSPLQKTKNSEN